MPYKSTDAAVESSPYYGQYRQLELERKRQNILKQKTDYEANPKFNETITRDNRGFIFSFENPLAFGKRESEEQENFELVTIELKSRIFLPRYQNKIDNEFKSF